MNNKEIASKTLWHRILGRIFKFLLTPLGITVLTDVSVMTKPPEADILLLRRKHDNWTPEQFERLPDGIRESNAHHILIEFKATESLSKEALIQAAAYEYFYKRSQKLTNDDIQIFVMCSIQPQKANREQYGYTIQLQSGVYKSEQIAFNHITLISLNELADELHNAWITCVASKELKRLKAFNILKFQGFKLIPKDFRWFLSDLWQHISTKGDYDMALKNLTPQQIEEFGKMWGEALLPTIPVEERLKSLKPEERLMGLKAEELLAGLPFSEIEELEKGIKKLKQQKKDQ